MAARSKSLVASVDEAVAAMHWLTDADRLTSLCAALANLGLITNSTT